MTIWIAIEIAACLILALLRNKIGFLCYQVCIAGVYLLSLTFVHTLDVTMAVYFFFAVVPYLKFFAIPTKLCFFTALYICFWAIVSVLNNSLTAVISALVIHYLGPLSLVYLYARIPDSVLASSFGMDGFDEKYVKAVVVVVAAFELVIAILASMQSTTGRLMLNYQCVSGCLACVSMVLLVYLVRNEKNRLFSLIAAFLMAFWAINSGTRGYIVLAIALLIVVLLTCFNGGKAILLLLGFAVAVIAIEITSPTGFLGNSLAERFSQTTGRRDAENQWALQMLAIQGPFTDLFGFGMGSRLGSQPYALDAFDGVSISAYNKSAIIGSNNLHNFWFSCVLSLGLIGFALYVAPFIQFCLRQKGVCDKHSHLVQLMFVCTYAFVLWFRWTATGGLLESCLLAYYIAATRRKRDTELSSDGAAPTKRSYAGHFNGALPKGIK